MQTFIGAAHGYPNARELAFQTARAGLFTNDSLRANRQSAAAALSASYQLPRSLFAVPNVQAVTKRPSTTKPAVQGETSPAKRKAAVKAAAFRNARLRTMLLAEARSECKAVKPQ